MRRVLLCLLIALATAPAAARAAAPIGHAGRWLTDGEGRVLILHGVDQVDKSAPYDPAQDLGPDDIAFLAAHGFDAVRVGVEYAGLEPRPGVYDEAYVERIRDVAEQLAAAGIAPLIDFHQDEYGPALGGNGFPAWATFTDGAPNQPDCGFGCNYLVRPDIQRAFDNLWLDHPAPDGVGIQEHFAAAAAHLASALRGIDGLLGYEFLNEPWPGSTYASCIPAGCPAFDRLLLDPFNEKVAKAIRAADPRHLVFYEPNVLFNDGVRTFAGPLAIPGAGFAFHVYCELSSSDATSEKPGGAQACPVQEQLAIDNAVSHVQQTHEALLLTEFGATPVDRPLRHITQLADENMIPWLYWAYTEYFKQDLALLERAYPQAVAGTPTSFAFDPATKRFTLAYTTRPAGAALAPGAPTVVYVPKLQYPGGYRVEVTGATVTSPPGAPRLELRNLPGAASVSLTVTPGA